MKLDSSKIRQPKIYLLLVVTATFLFAPTSARATRTLASEALAAAITNGTLDEVTQEVMMDAFQKQRFEIDEAGIEALGRSLLAQEKNHESVQILQLNQGLHHTSPAAAVALADAYLASGEDVQASIYYEMALRMDPQNDAAKRGLEETGSVEEMAMGSMAAMADMEFDPAAMQDAMAQMGMEMSPEQLQEMQEAMELMQQYAESGEMPQAMSSPQQQTRRAAPEATAEAKYESEQCEVLHRFNAHKRVLDAALRASVTGNYQEPDHANWTWNIESYCGDFLVAVPLWADVGPPVLEAKGGNSFADSNGATWQFEMDKNGKTTGVLRTDADGTATKLKRLGDPKKYQ
jgi:tetratricopeptide (TPR) repeat protein